MDINGLNLFLACIVALELLTFAPHKDFRHGELFPPTQLKPCYKYPLTHWLSSSTLPLQQKGPGM